MTAEHSAVLPWQQDLWQRVVAAAGGGRLAHALLLAGARGVGKRRFARRLAAYVLCEAPEGARPCGRCRGCIQFGAGTHPNVFLLSPAEDKRDIAIDDVRGMIEGLQLSSHYGRAKIAIIEPADALNPSSVNALLKTIEEPARDTHVLLISERWRALPATLRSRCQMVRFPSPPEAEALAWLQRRFPGTDPAALRPWARQPLLAEAGLEAGVPAAQDEWARALADLHRGDWGALRLAQGMKREQAQARLEWLLRFGTGWLAQRLAPAAAAPRRPPLPQGATAANLRMLLDDALEGLRQLQRNVSPSMILEWIMIRWLRRAAGGA